VECEFSKTTPLAFNNKANKTKYQPHMQLNAKDVTRQVITLEPNRTLYDSRNSLLRYNISRIVVAKDNKPLGIVTEKDISRFLYRDVSNRRLNEIRLDEMMSKNLVVAREGDDLKACAKLMLENKISSIIVIDNNNGLKGIFTKSDLIDVYAKYYPRKSLQFLLFYYLKNRLRENAYMVRGLIFCSTSTRISNQNSRANYR
jgi:CBS domain-containing protein